MTKSDQSSRMPPSGMTGTPLAPDQDWGKVLHRLNNIFACIHSSLDLALTLPVPPEASRFLKQAQTSAREGALLVNDARFHGDVPAALKAGASKHEPKASAAAKAAVTPPSLEGTERILLVEDDESVRLLVRAVLTYRGYDVTEACDGEAAVRLFGERGPFELVILDQAMPKLDGKGALEKIRAMDAGVPALGLSGLPPDYDSGPKTGAARGFDAQLSKPFDNSELVTVVRRLLDAPACRQNQAAAGPGTNGKTRRADS